MEIFGIIAKAKNMLINLVEESGSKEIMGFKNIKVFIKSCKHSNKNWFVKAVVQMQDKRWFEVEMRLSESGELRAYEFDVL